MELCEEPTKIVVKTRKIYDQAESEFTLQTSGRDDECSSQETVMEDDALNEPENYFSRNH